MSAISSVGVSSQSQLLQQLQQQRQKPGSDADQQAAIQSALQAAGVDPSKISGIESQIKAAVQGVLSGSSGTPANQRQAVQQAVDSVLQKNGVDTDKFKTVMQSAHKAGGHKHHHGGKNAAQTTSADASQPTVTTNPTSLFPSNSAIDTQA